MKQDIHPEYKLTHVTCSCGNTFTTRSVESELHVELCNQCHPFYTGKQKLVDTGGRVERFQKKYAAKQHKRPSPPPAPEAEAPVATPETPVTIPEAPAETEEPNASAQPETAATTAGVETEAPEAAEDAGSDAEAETEAPEAGSDAEAETEAPEAVQDAGSDAEAESEESQA